MLLKLKVHNQSIQYLNTALGQTGIAKVPVVPVCNSVAPEFKPQSGNIFYSFKQLSVIGSCAFLKIEKITQS